VRQRVHLARDQYASTAELGGVRLKINSLTQKAAAWRSCRSISGKAKKGVKVGSVFGVGALDWIVRKHRTRDASVALGYAVDVMAEQSANSVMFSPSAQQPRLRKVLDVPLVEYRADDFYRELIVSGGKRLRRVGRLSSEPVALGTFGIRYGHHGQAELSGAAQGIG